MCSTRYWKIFYSKKSNGLETKDENRNKLVGFLYVVGVLGDYTAVYECLDVLRHSTSIFCTFRMFHATKNLVMLAAY